MLWRRRAGIKYPSLALSSCSSFNLPANPAWLIHDHHFLLNLVVVAFAPRSPLVPISPWLHLRPPPSSPTPSHPRRVILANYLGVRQ
ncbi:hypothetical protein LX32DRAFT_641230 [Colletotrichum zoysiae]|uniref:Uncharacterized protein n=1 Tax=Colletotrichum zoysiae TaxID=1216348 RepID=A0AAD9M371_9PEZI|nr:hypothetical protein LX32DRAFT_641230 [Colletotrichum zoysiae]